MTALCTQKNASPKMGVLTKTVSEKGHGKAGPGRQDLLRVYRISSEEGGRAPGLRQALVGQGKEVAAMPAGRRIGDNQKHG